MTTYEIYRNTYTQQWELVRDGEPVVDRQTSLEIALDFAECMDNDDAADPLVVEVIAPSSK